MVQLSANVGYNHDGEPCDFVDETGIVWVYIGKRDGFDVWGRCFHR